MTCSHAYGRRGFLAGLALCGAAGFAGSALAFGADATTGSKGVSRPRLAAIDWAMLETACAIGHTPLSACELIRFRQDNPSVVIPDDMTDLGLRGSPNFELMWLTKPDLILSSPFYTRLEDKMSAIAPVFSLPFFTSGEAPLNHAFAALSGLADRLDDPRAGKAAIDAAQRQFDQLARAARSQAERPVMLIDFGDARHFRAFGEDSLYGSTLSKLGLQNAWRDRTLFSFTAPVALDRLADLPDAVFVLVADIPLEAREPLRRSALWKSLEPVQQGRVLQLPSSNAYGGVPSALQFAGDLVQALATL